MSKQCAIYETLNPITEMHVTKENGLMTLSGTFGVCGVRNNNQRVYEAGNYSKMVTEMQGRIKENGGIPGELEHPQTMNITLENVSHKITEINIDENGVVSGTIQLLNTPKGQIAQAIVEGGLPLFVSSRAMGQVDKSGKVTLEKLSTYDLVGTPGFSQARMHLNESQMFESLSDNCCIITEKESNENNMENSQELLERFEALEARISELETRNEELKEALEEANKFDLKTLADGIEKWVIEEYSPTIQDYITEEALPEALMAAKKMVVNEAGPLIQKWVVEEFGGSLEKWVVEEFGGQMEKWVLEQYSPEIEKWVTNIVAPGIQSWLVEHFSPSIQEWVSESYGQEVKNMIDEGLKANKDSKLSSIADTLSMLESIDVKKPVYGNRAINENNIEEPVYIANMPDQYRPKYNMASQELKESIARRAKITDFTVEGAIDRFWERIDFDAQVQVTENVRDLNTIEDQHERSIRAAFRRNRRF